MAANGILAAIAIARSAIEVVEAVQGLIERAEREGRDLSPDELSQLRQRREGAEARWKSALERLEDPATAASAADGVAEPKDEEPEKPTGGRAKK